MAGHLRLVSGGHRGFRSDRAPHTCSIALRVGNAGGELSGNLLTNKVVVAAQAETQSLFLA
jgi:hypothetical protein